MEIKVIDIEESLFVSPQDRQAVVYGKAGVAWALVIPDRSREGVTLRPMPLAKNAGAAAAADWARRFMEVNNIDWLDE